MKSCQTCRYKESAYTEAPCDECEDPGGFGNWEPEEPMVTVERRTVEVFVTTDGTRFFEAEEAAKHQVELAVRKWVDTRIDCFAPDMGDEIIRSILEDKDGLIQEITTGKMVNEPLTSARKVK